MDADLLRESIASVPPGRWGVGVSGGADSVALLLLLKQRPELSLHVAHLDHQTRAGESALDAQFVLELAEKLGLPSTVAPRSQIEGSSPSPVKNTSSRYRAARLSLYRQIVENHALAGVVLAHHADDQAETVLLRILRGSSPESLGGMREESNVQDLRILRPLLNVPSEWLRQFLQEQHQTWREDSSNQSDGYQRNRLRKWLRHHPQMRGLLQAVDQKSKSLRAWLDESCPRLSGEFESSVLQSAPLPLARHSAARWLVSHGAPLRDINARTCERLVEMAADAESPARQDFPGGVDVRRKAGKIRAN